MADNPKGPDIMEKAGQAASEAAPVQDAPLTRKDLEELLGMQAEKTKKQYEGLRSATDKKFNTLQQQFQQAAAQQAAVANYSDTGDGEGQPQGYDYGTQSDRDLAMLLAERRAPGFDYSKIDPILSDPAQSQKYLRLKGDGRTVDWPEVYTEAFKDIEIQEARALLEEKRQKDAEAEVLREKQKIQATISGSDASYPEGVKIPRTREEARSLSDAELAEAMVAEFDIPDREMPDFVKENRKG